MNGKILVMAGGTGGHIFPGLAVADALAEQGWQICWLGTKERMEATLVPEHGYPIHFIDVVGLRGKGLLKKLFAPFMLLRSILQAMAVIRQEKPEVVLGLGGYASGPGGIAAWLLGKPLLLHEQNAVAGMTNRILARFSKKVLVAFPNTFEGRANAVLVGNPIRKDIAALAKMPRDLTASDEPLKVLILGGSLGALALNENVPQILAAAKAKNTIAVWHQTGRGNQEKVAERYQTLLKDNDKVKVTEFITDMVSAYAWADLVICRAGALTVAEVAAAGVGAIFVPYPYAVDDHQTTNAGWLADNGAAIIIQQQDLMTPENITRIGELIEDRQALNKMAQHAKRVAITDATDKVAGYCKALADPYGIR